jgi:hypothetical protein
MAGSQSSRLIELRDNPDFGCLADNGRKELTFENEYISFGYYFYSQYSGET